ncbi:protein C3orf33 homolog [Oncorhynchus nerka]|uniref:protein C3orf33 homolog n=1 Tax=Oncorhynchus nerka TaxID=8023 RepID=UPI0031B815A6
MPESRSEAETDEKGETQSKNIISVISQFADDNLTIVRNISTGLAIAGVIVISRSIKLITRFGLASEIPARFIEKNVSLRGRVQTITETGLEVEHIPIYIPVLSPLLAKGMEDPLPAKGMENPLLAKGMEDPLLTKGMEDPLPAKGMEDPLLAKGMEDPLPAKGMEDPPLTKGMEDPLLTKGMVDPLLAKGMEDPLSAKGMEDHLPAKSMEDPLLAFLGHRLDLCPQVYRLDLCPQVYRLDLCPQVYRLDLCPQVYRLDLCPQVFSPQVVVVCLTWQVFSPQVYRLPPQVVESHLTLRGSHLAARVNNCLCLWLKLVSREEETLHCLVSVSRGSLRSLCLNEEVLRLGLARTVPVSGLHPQSHLYLRLHQRLLKAEVKAERKGRGMWKEDSLWERTSQAVWDNSLVRLIRRIFKWT